MFTLGIDYGASNIGIALVRNNGEGNDEAVFAGTMVLDARKLKEKVENRAALRRLRRTRKTKKRRLRELNEKLLNLGIDSQAVSRIAGFCERRGYKSLFDEEESDKGKSGEESAGRPTREDFFQSLEYQLSQILQSENARCRALAVCERVLNRAGERHLEVRPLRIENRGVSRCAWEGCNKTPPRSANAIDDKITQALVTYFQGRLKERPSLLDTLSSAVAELKTISHQLRADASANPKRVKQKARKILDSLRGDLTEPDAIDDEGDKNDWDHVRESVRNIIVKKPSGGNRVPSGRNTYCREHSREYVRYVLEGKRPPFKQTIAESDIISRREQIAFSKLWRYIEARVLPLAPEGIDRIVVERTAFDMLAGSRKKLRKTSDGRIEEMYQQGPRFGYRGDDKAMLRAEFGGLCVYCGKEASELVEREHILPRADFFFDSYLNIVPACPRCNAEKGRSRPGPAALHISEAAYANYDKYLKTIARQRPLHFLHHEKKGILNLMRDPKRSWEYERYMGFIANKLAAIVQSQRGPRPFARFLYSKLATRQDKVPDIKFRSGRHIALYRNAAYPNFEKKKDKTEGSTLNHALDALLLASKLPNLSLFEKRGINVKDFGTWCRSVRSSAPVPGREGVPEIPVYPWYVPGFESVSSQGYVEVQMAAMNWNRKDSATHKQDPWGWSAESGKPAKRSSALELYQELLNEKARTQVSNKVNSIHHPSLKAAMAEGLNADPAGPAVAKAMKEWLRKSVRNSLDKSVFSNHPADLTRKRKLEDFVNNADSEIPQVIGVKRTPGGVDGKIDLERIDPNSGKVIHRYQTEPTNQAVILAYPLGSDGTPNLQKPCVLNVGQHLALKTQPLRCFKPKPPELENGVAWNGSKDHRRGWKEKVETYLSECGFHSYALLTRCCAVCYKDGTQRLIRNFEKEFFKPTKILKNVVGMKRTPFSPRIVPLKVLTPKAAK